MRSDEKLTAFLELELIVHNAISYQRQVSPYIKIRPRLTRPKANGIPIKGGYSNGFESGGGLSPAGSSSVPDPQSRTQRERGKRKEEP